MATTHRARQLSTGKWFQIVQATDPPMTNGTFRALVSVAFSVSEADVEVIVTDWTSAERETAANQMSTGIYAGAAVTPALVRRKPVTETDRLHAAVAAVDTSTIVDVKVKTALDDLKAALRSYRP